MASLILYSAKTITIFRTIWKCNTDAAGEYEKYMATFLFSFKAMPCWHSPHFTRRLEIIQRPHSLLLGLAVLKSLQLAQTFQVCKNFPGSNATLLPWFLGLMLRRAVVKSNRDYGINRVVLRNRNMTCFLAFLFEAKSAASIALIWIPVTRLVKSIMFSALVDAGRIICAQNSDVTITTTVTTTDNHQPMEEYAHPISPVEI